MKIIRQAQFHPTGRVLTLGNFDGVHKGHQALMAEVVRQAEKHQALPTVVTFYPPPKAYFLPKGKYAFITPFTDKCLWLAKFGIVEILSLRFNKSLADMSAEDFINVHLRPLNIKAIILGDDFHFGKNRTGNIETLKQAGKTLGFEVLQIGTQSQEGFRISSSKVRERLTNNETEGALDLLGHPLSITGHVCHGDKRGRTLGFPTLNVHIRDPLCYSGIFAVKILDLFQEPVFGVASLGVRPMYGALEKQLLEVHVFDKTFEAYGKKITVELSHKIREEQMFESETQMVEAIHHDLHKAKVFFGIA